MRGFPWVRNVLAPVTAAVLGTVLLASAVTPASAHAGHPSAPKGSTSSLAAQAAAVDHGSHAGTADTTTPLARDCDHAAATRPGDPVVLSIHDGFQEAPTCAVTEMGEVPTQANGPTLLIVDAPRIVRVGQPITLKVSTRNLVRDRFLAAGAGGYYDETSLLTGAGLVRGHFHTACQNIGNGRTAPAPDRQTDTFVATEDGKGGSAPDTVTVTTPKGLSTTGLARCVVWAGDGSHRTPMEQFANQIIAVDSVRLLVIGARGDREDRNRRGNRDDG